MNEQSTSFPIVGIGASAGGIPAMEGLFHGMPDNPGAAFVIVTHLNPQHESLLHEVIGRYTTMPFWWPRMAPPLSATMFMSCRQTRS
jgi:two-component system CheB/CheR fusion protein